VQLLEDRFRTGISEEVVVIEVVGHVRLGLAGGIEDSHEHGQISPVSISLLLNDLINGNSI